jgi:tetratricopeptide (TPR) repeat protein
VAAAEALEASGDPEGRTEAVRLAGAARDEHPRDPVAVRLLRRLATRAGALEPRQARRWLEEEAAAPVAPRERAPSLLLLAELERAQGQLSMAEKHARTALSLGGVDLPGALFLYEVAVAQRRTTEADVALEKLAVALGGAPAAALLTDLAERAEAAGRTRRAVELASRAGSQGGEALLRGRLVEIRGALASGDPATAAERLLAAGAPFVGRGGAAFRRLAAAILRRGGAPLEDRRRVLDAGPGEDPVLLRARAEEAAEAGDDAAEEAALAALAGRTAGIDRAEALGGLAQLRLARGDAAGAAALFEEARDLDPGLAVVRVVRDLLRDRGLQTFGPTPTDPVLRSSLGPATGAGPRPQTAAPDAALRDAAGLAAQLAALQEERDALTAAEADEGSLEVVQMIALDAAAEAGDLAATFGHLSRYAEQQRGPRRLAALLALAELEESAGRREQAVGHLRAVLDASPGDPLATRPLLRAAGSGRDGAALLLAEASGSDGPRSAFAATWAGRLLLDGGSDPAPAFDRALAADGAYPPALWAAERPAREAGDAARLATVHERLASLHDALGDAPGSTMRWFRAGLERASIDARLAASSLERALAGRPGDPILVDLLERLYELSEPGRALDLLDLAAAGAPAPMRPALRMRLAGLLEDRGHLERAEDLHRTLVDDRGADVAVVSARALDRIALAGDRFSSVVAALDRRAQPGESPATRLAALLELAEIELHDRRDPAAAAGRWRAVLELEPTHPVALRGLEVWAMGRPDGDDEWLEILEAWLARLDGGKDRARLLRLAHRLRTRGAADHAAGDELLLRWGRRATLDAWGARQLAAAGHGARDDELVARAWEALEAVFDGPRERAGARLARVLATPGSAGDRADLLAPVVRDGDHPTAPEHLARLAEGAGRFEEAAAAFEQAARRSRVRERGRELWYRAGCLWQDRLGRDERARAAFTVVAGSDVGFEDVFERLRRLLEAAGDRQALADLLRARVEAGGDAGTLAKLHLELARERLAAGQRESAEESFRAALALWHRAGSPASETGVRDRREVPLPDGEAASARSDASPRQASELATLALELGDWRNAAELLVRVGRGARDRRTLHWVFATLGDLYQARLPDPDRATAAYERVLQIAPRDVHALSQLVRLYTDAGRHDDAAEAYRSLVASEIDPEKERAHRLGWAEALERAGDPAGAEEVLQALARERPEDLDVRRRLMALYRSSGNAEAAASQLEHVFDDLRRQVETDPGRSGLWRALSDALAEADRPDAAACAASAAAALGMADADLLARVDRRGGARPLGPRACAPDLDPILAPRGLDEATRVVLALAEEALDRALPFDLKATRAERLKDAGLLGELREVVGWFGAGDPTVWVSDALPRVCAPLGPGPTLLVGRELLRITTAEERRFLFVRATKVSVARLSFVLRSGPDQVAAALGALGRLFDPAGPMAADAVPGADELARRLGRLIPRRQRPQFEERVPRMGTAGRPPDPQRLGLAASQLGDRVALAALGAVPVAYGAMLKLAGVLGARDDWQRRLDALSAVPEAAALVTYAISDSFFEARRRAGAEGGR